LEDPETVPLLASVFLDAVFKPFAPEILISMAIMLFLLLCSALISGSEIAFFSLDPPQLHELKTNNDQKNTTILNLLETPKRLLATILITNNFVNVGIVILSTYVTAELFYLEKFPVLAFMIQVIVVASLILLFGEIIPKVYATQYPVRFARFMSKPLRILLRVFTPLSSLLVNSTNFIDKRLAKRNQNFSMDELSEAIDIATDDDSTKEEKKILKGIVKFGNIIEVFTKSRNP
jgi:Mg2+/Co2+ transporter CorB